MLLSSAYLTKRCPRRSSSRSSSSSTRLLNSGESGPPWGVPSTLGLANPFSITPAFRNARMSFNSRLMENRSEEHTSELQSPVHLVCRLLLEKKKTTEYQL